MDSPKAAKKPKKGRIFDPQVFLETVGLKRSITQCPPNHKIFSQGDPSDAVFYIQKGRVKLTTLSKHGKEAVIAILGARDFLGEACLMGQLVRVASATAIVPSAVLRIEKGEMLRVLQKERNATADQCVKDFTDRRTSLRRTWDGEPPIRHKQQTTPH